MLVTCDRAPSATCSKPTPSCALVSDCVRACEFGCSPLTSERPAASSAPELIFDPEDSCCSVFERLFCVLLRLFAAYIAERLFKTPRDMGFSLRCVGLRPFPGCVLPFSFASLGCCFGVLPSHLAHSSASVYMTLCGTTKCSEAGHIDPVTFNL